jgi:uncharacterized protein
LRQYAALPGPRIPAMDMNPPAPIETPCVKVCVIEPDSGLCIGCGRSRLEIGKWLGLTAAERRAVMGTLPERLATLTVNKRRRGGRRARLADSARD